MLYFDGNAMRRDSDRAVLHMLKVIHRVFSYFYETGAIL